MRNCMESMTTFPNITVPVLRIISLLTTQLQEDKRWCVHDSTTAPKIVCWGAKYSTPCYSGREGKRSEDVGMSGTERNRRKRGEKGIRERWKRSMDNEYGNEREDRKEKIRGREGGKDGKGGE